MHVLVLDARLPKKLIDYFFSVLKCVKMAKTSEGLYELLKKNSACPEKI